MNNSSKLTFLLETRLQKREERKCVEECSYCHIVHHHVMSRKKLKKLPRERENQLVLFHITLHIIIPAYYPAPPDANSEDKL